MNTVMLIGRLTKDPEVRYTESQLAIARFSIAVNREGKDKGVDFLSIVVFGKLAENCERYLSKGRRVAIQGSIQTGSYTNKDGNKVYTTEIIANKVEFLEWGEDVKTKNEDTNLEANRQYDFKNFEDEDVPF